MIKWHLATKQQLTTILYEKDCPLPLWMRAVEEMLNHNWFDLIIWSAIYRTVKPDVMEKYHRVVSRDDLMQIGRIEIWKIKDRFNFEKSKDFFLFAYVCVKQKIQKVARDLEAAKRDNRNVESYPDQEKERDILFKDSITNVENYVVNKIYIEQLLKTINPNQRRILYYHYQGYTFEEISKILGRGNYRSMHESFHAAIKKMRKGVS